MNDKTKTHRYLARVCIEFVTPFHVGTGAADDLSDAAVVCDANGLPAIPGSSLAGVLRSEFERCSPGHSNRLFGFQNGNSGAGSMLKVSWGCIHDCHNIPVDGLAEIERLEEDAVLASALNLTIRDHVRIHHRGASDAEDSKKSARRSGHGKFDEKVVCAGHRFSFEIEMSGDGDNDRTLWENFLPLIHSQTLRIGGRSRRGFGAFKVISLASAVFDLRKDMADYLRHPVSLALPSAVLSPLNLGVAEIPDASCALDLELEPDGYWMFGGGIDSAGDGADADMAPVRDRQITWQGNDGEVSENILVIPGSSVKGALSHRVAYHYNQLTGNWADDDNGMDPIEITGENNCAVKEWFGYCKDRSAEGKRGRVMINDIYLHERTQQFLHHVTIDRYTGGATTGHLFSERPVWKGPKIELRINFSNLDRKMDKRIVLAMKSALEDLAGGRLQLGAGSGRGHGFFRCGNFNLPEFFNLTADREV